MRPFSSDQAERGGDSAAVPQGLQSRSADCAAQRGVTLGHERREMVTYMASLAFFIPYRCNDCLRKDHLSTLVVGYLQTNTGIVKMKQRILGEKKSQDCVLHFLKWESTRFPPSLVSCNHGTASGQSSWRYSESTSSADRAEGTRCQWTA